MAMDDDDRPEDVTSQRRRNRRRRVAVGTTGAAAVLGACAYIVTAEVVREDSAATRETVVLAPAVSADPVTPSASVSGSPSAEPSAAETKKRTAGQAAMGPQQAQKRIEEAREAQARAGIKVTKPLPAPSKMLPESAIKERVKKTRDSLLRITTARGDLTDQKDHRIVAGKPIRVGEVSCTQRFRFALNAELKTMPTMMVCWRISERRSVITLGVMYKGKPAASTYASIIQKEWEKLS